MSVTCVPRARMAGKSLVARRIQEGDLPAFEVDFVGADVLGDAPGLSGDHVAFADVVEEGGLAVVHVSHDGDDWGTGLEDAVVLFFFIFDILEAVLGLLLDLETELGRDPSSGYPCPAAG